MAFVFYDTETTGLDTGFDQILQFAAILTDENFVEKDRFEIRCRLLPHIVPAVGALRTNRVRPAMLTNPELCSHYTMTCAIADKLKAWSPAVFIGFNSLGFDEKLLRQTFYQNLKPTYLTNTNHNTRADILRLVQAASVYAPGSITIPTDASGRETRKLEAIAQANGFNQHNAHDALGDVEATIFMARLVKERAPQIWSALMPLAAKPAVVQRALSGQVLSLTDFFKGKPYSWLVVGCGQDPDYDAQLGVFDLKYDPAKYINLSVDELIDVSNSKAKAIRCIKANNQPILLPRDLASADLHELKIDSAEIQRRAQMILDAKDFQTRVGEAIGNRYPEGEPARYVEQRIYEGFPSRSDEGLMQRFHQVPWAERVPIVEQIRDERIQEFGYRLIHLEQPEALPAEKRAELDAWRALRLMPAEAEVPWQTLAEAQADAEKTMGEDPEDKELVTEIQSWLRTFAIAA